MGLRLKFNLAMLLALLLGLGIDATYSYFVSPLRPAGSAERGGDHDVAGRHYQPLY